MNLEVTTSQEIQWKKLQPRLQEYNQTTLYTESIWSRDITRISISENFIDDKMERSSAFKYQKADSKQACNNLQLRNQLQQNAYLGRKTISNQ